MFSRISIVLFLFVVLASPVLSATTAPQPSGDLALLNQRASNVLEEVIALRQEVTVLQKRVDELDKSLNESKEKLKRVSVASTTARRCLSLIRKSQPEWEYQSAVLQEKMVTLQAKQASLKAVETEISWLEDNVSGFLLKNVSEFVANRD